MFQTTNQKGGGLLHSGQFSSKKCVKHIVEASGMVFHGYIQKKVKPKVKKWPRGTIFQWSQLLWLISSSVDCENTYVNEQTMTNHQVESRKTKTYQLMSTTEQHRIYLV